MLIRPYGILEDDLGTIASLWAQQDSAARYLQELQKSRHAQLLLLNSSDAFDQSQVTGLHGKICMYSADVLVLARSISNLLMCADLLTNDMLLPPQTSRKYFWNLLRSLRPASCVGNRTKSGRSGSTSYHTQILVSVER